MDTRPDYLAPLPAGLDRTSSHPGVAPERLESSAEWFAHRAGRPGFRNARFPFRSGSLPMVPFGWIVQSVVSIPETAGVRNVPDRSVAHTVVSPGQARGCRAHPSVSMADIDRIACLPSGCLAKRDIPPLRSSVLHIRRFGSRAKTSVPMADRYRSRLHGYRSHLHRYGTNDHILPFGIDHQLRAASTSARRSRTDLPRL